MGPWSGSETNVRRGILGGNKEYFSYSFFCDSRAPYAYLFFLWKAGVDLKIISDKYVNVDYLEVFRNPPKMWVTRCPMKYFMNNVKEL